MGYDSTIVVVEKSTIVTQKRKYARVIAVIEMCKCNQEFHKLFSKYTDCYFNFPGKVNTDVFTDNYDAAIMECPDNEKLLKFLHENRKFYRRYKVLFDIIKSFVDNKDFNITVLHYGH